MNAGHLLVITGFARLSEIAGTRPAMTEEDASPAQLVMAGHSRPKDGVLSRAYVPAISFREAKPCPPKRDRRHKAGDDRGGRLTRAACHGRARPGHLVQGGKAMPA
jgi:hypothetical protein